MVIWRSCIAKSTLAIWHYFIAKCTRAILATSYRLNRNNIVSSFYETRGSKLCFSHVSLILVATNFYLVFSQNRYSLISSHLFWLHGNPISRPVSRTFGNPSWYVVHVPPCFWHRMRGFLEVRCSWEPGSRLTTGDLSPFCLSPKVSDANVHQANANHTFLTHKNPQTDTFLCDISLAKLHSTAWVRNPQGTSRLMNKVDCCLSYDNFLAHCSRL
jgi:hypothetical protein